MLRVWPFVIIVTVVSGFYEIYVRLRSRLRQQSTVGKIVVVTGASSGIGLSTAEAFHKAGSQVIVASRDISKLETLCSELVRKYGARGSFPKALALDLENVDSIIAFAQNLCKECSHVDVLVNNAGLGVRGSVADTTLAVFRRVMDVNFLGTVALTKEILPLMANRSVDNPAHIVMVSSVQGKLGIPERAAYGAAKHALQAFSDTLRLELADSHVRVSVICPGYVKTNMSFNAVTGSGQKHDTLDKDYINSMDPADIASAIVQSVRNDRGGEIILAPWHNKAAIILRNICPNLLNAALLIRYQRGKAKAH